MVAGRYHVESRDQELNTIEIAPDQTHLTVDLWDQEVAIRTLGLEGFELNHLRVLESHLKVSRVAISVSADVRHLMMVHSFRGFLVARSF